MSTELVPGKSEKEAVKLWLRTVGKIIDEGQAIEKKVEEGNFLSRAHLGKNVAKKIEKVKELLQNDYSRDSLVIDTPSSSEEDVKFPVTTLVGRSIAIKRDKIWAYLMDDDVRKVGVYGMGGIGKTSVMKQINNKLGEDTDKFDKVIWVTVSEAHNVFQLQNEIARQVNEDLSKLTDETRRAARLSSALSTSKLNWVLILDDMWEAFSSLDDVGIPEPTRANGCKLVLTTRDSEVCRRMGCEEIGLELLSEQEAWNLFSKGVGDVSTKPNIKAIVEQVAKECACLPLAIVTIAASMKGVVDINEWSSALEDLQSSTEGLTDMRKVLEKLKFSYTRLENDKLRHCFLYCALYPEDSKIDRMELIRHLIAEEIIEEMNSRKAQFERGHAMLNKLEYACLLENATDNQEDAPKLVKMHDLLRDMAIQITRTDPRFLIEAGVRPRQLPEAEKWREDLERVSLMCNNASVIPSSFPPPCDRLRTLLLLRNYDLVKIPASFFTHMRGLKVLDISYTSIEDLPSSVSELENLTALYLTNCTKLKSVPSLEKLRLLRELDLSYTGIKEVPQGMEMLANLRYLNLYESDLEMLPVGILPKLSRLQCLLLSRESKTLKVKGKELACLRKLETFAGQFPSLHDLNTYVRSLHDDRPKNYVLQLGQGEDDSYSWNEENYTSKEVRVKESSSNGGQGEDYLVVPNEVELVSVHDCHDLTSLFDISSSSSSICSPLECLETLELDNLQKLRFLFRGEGSTLPPSVFSCLKELSIQSCPNIKKLFTSGLSLQLQNLEEIAVYDCEQMEEIKAEADDEVGKSEASSSSSSRHNPYILPKLKALSLTKLPALKSICKGTVISPFLEYITVYQCPRLKKLPLAFHMINEQLSTSPNLKMITVQDKRWWEMLEWDHPHSKNVLRRFCRFIDR